MSTENDKPPGCKLYTVTCSTEFEVSVAAPLDMNAEDVRQLIRAKLQDMVRHLVDSVDWKQHIMPLGSGDAEDTHRDTWIVNDARDDFVVGEETAWLPEGDK